MSDEKTCMATEPKTLEDKIMNSNIPKSEAEWWACRRIQELEAENDRLRGELAEAQRQLRVVRESLWLNHGHTGLYGDDCEMQCGACEILDYKRAPIEALLRQTFKHLKLQFQEKAELWDYTKSHQGFIYKLIAKLSWKKDIDFEHAFEAAVKAGKESKT